MTRTELTKLIKECHAELIKEESKGEYKYKILYKGTPIITFESDDVSVSNSSDVPNDVISNVKILNENAIAYLLLNVDWPSGVTVTGFKMEEL